mmetsp:Transcript_84240/g.234632  ORF Transcript_84240/g.234632 Transcript_84240/m.234632 type:complete len:204 (+) Transcript_84240:166-777(+)
MGRLLTSTKLQASIAETRKRRDLRSAMSRPEVHVIGEVVGGSGFGAGVSCKWSVDTGSQWKALNGEPGGQTHVDYPEAGDFAVWNHPVDLHYVAGSIDGWPRIVVQVWRLDEFGRNDLEAYGFVHVPTSAGSFDVEVPTWRPLGSHKVEMASFFLGGRPQLKSLSVIHAEAGQRFRLVTESSGTVHLHLDVVLKHLAAHKVEW